jgi:ATP-dependent Lon protease
MLGRDFAFITLGGANDGSFLVGHSYTYEGSNYGKISDILIQCKSDNPIIFFDELDKVSDSFGGNEIIGILTHLIDSTQNNEFHDKYFSEIDINVSKCLFVFSFCRCFDELMSISLGIFSQVQIVQIVQQNMNCCHCSTNLN